MAPPRRPLAKKVSGAFLSQEERKQESADDMRCAIQFSIAYHRVFRARVPVRREKAGTPFWLFSARGRLGGAINYYNSFRGRH